MDSVLNAVIRIGPAALLAGSVAALVCYVRARATAGPFLAYVSRVALVGVLAFAAGAVAGVGLFCLPEDAGNLCGLGGVLGLGPLASGLGIGVYAHLRTKAARSAR